MSSSGEDLYLVLFSVERESEENKDRDGIGERRKEECEGEG